MTTSVCFSELKKKVVVFRACVVQVRAGGAHFFFFIGSCCSSPFIWAQIFAHALNALMMVVEEAG